MTETESMANGKNSHADDATMTTMPDYENEIITVLRSSVFPRAIQELLEDYHGNDIAQVMEDLTPQERSRFFKIASSDLLAETFEYLDEEDAITYFHEIDLWKVIDILSKLDADKAEDILAELDKTKRALIIDALSPEVRSSINLIASFDEEEIGSRMTTNYITLHQGISCEEAMKELVSQAKRNDNISTLFVVDDDGVLYGAIDLRKLITAKPDVNVNDLAVTSFPYVYASEKIDDCIERIKDYSEDSIPVLNNANCLLGVITASSMVELVDEEMGEDYARLAGLTAEEDLQETLLESMQKRLPWLLVLLALGVIVSSVVGVFERVVAQLTLIMAFQSLILDMSGNVGTQSLAVTIRVLMDENLSAGQKFQLVVKEVRVGLCNGLILGLISTVLVGLYIAVVKQRPLMFSFAVSSCIGTAMLVAMTISSAVGTLIPLFFKRINIDPAVASGPLITTMNDLVAVVTYYGLAWVLLINVLHLG